MCIRDRFWSQWEQLKDYANSQGVRIVGDLPLGVAADSADVWAHRELFQLDSRGWPSRTAGVPPDYYCPDGQNWGSPVYDWDAVKGSGYRWWIDRLGHAMKALSLIHIWWRTASSSVAARWKRARWCATVSSCPRRY